MFWRHAASLVPIPGVREGLRLLAERNLAMGCVSNAVFSGEVLKYELERHRLADSIQFLISSADVGARKPCREIFSAATARLKMEPSRVWFVGDTWSADIEGASAAGLFPVWLSGADESPGTVQHARVASWDRLSELIRDVLG